MFRYVYEANNILLEKRIKIYEIPTARLVDESNNLAIIYMLTSMLMRPTVEAIIIIHQLPLDPDTHSSDETMQFHVLIDVHAHKMVWQ